MRTNAASQGHPSHTQDSHNMQCNSNPVGGVYWRPWRPASHHWIIQHFFLSLSLCNRSHPLSLWEQRAPLGKIQQSTSNGGDGRCDSNVTAMSMDAATVTQRQRDSNNDATTMMGHGSLAAAQWQRWQQLWQRNRMTAVAAEAWQQQLGGSAVATAVMVAALAAWRRQRQQLGSGAVGAAGWRLRQHGSGGGGNGGGSATAQRRRWWRWQLGSIGGGILAVEWCQLSSRVVAAAWVAAAAPWHRWQPQRWW